MASLALDLEAAIRTIPDYPKEGILFRDITTLLGNPRAFRRAVDLDCENQAAQRNLRSIAPASSRPQRAEEP